MINFLSALGSDALLEILKQSSGATAIYTTQDLIIQFANDAMLSLWEKNQSVRSKRVEDEFPEIDGQYLINRLKNVWTSGETLDEKDIKVSSNLNGTIVTSYFDFSYQPITNKNGQVYCILHTAVDVTDRVSAWEMIRKKEHREFKMKEKLQAANEKLTAINEELQTGNEELAALNEEHKSTNELLDKSMKIKEELNQTQIVSH